MFIGIFFKERRNISPIKWDNACINVAYSHQSTTHLHIVTFMFALGQAHKAPWPALCRDTCVVSAEGAHLTSTPARPARRRPGPCGPLHTESISQIDLPPAPCSAVFSLVSTVLNDIISTMFNQKFMEELFKPQELYSKKALRTVYDRLAHASIMRLNQASMDKVRADRGLCPLGGISCTFCGWAQTGSEEMRYATVPCQNNNNNSKGTHKYQELVLSFGVGKDLKSSIPAPLICVSFHLPKEGAWRPCPYLGTTRNTHLNPTPVSAQP